MTETIDFTMMYVTHNAFRRDLDRLTAATTVPRGGWQNFKNQLHLHHSVEDSHLWPPLQRAVTEPRDVALLEQMEAEHNLIDPLLTAVDTAMADPHADGLTEALKDLSTALRYHLVHEEEDALPLIQSTLTPADWKTFADEMRRRQGFKGAAVYVPWILDGAPAAERRRFLSALPAPVTLFNRLLWQPRYVRLGFWSDVA